MIKRLKQITAFILVVFLAANLYSSAGAENSEDCFLIEETEIKTIDMEAIHAIGENSNASTDYSEAAEASLLGEENVVPDTEKTEFTNESEEDLLLEVSEETEMETGEIAELIIEEENRDLIVNNDTVSDGTCGDSAFWTLDSQGTLLISGTGTIWSYSTLNRAPWYNLRSSITQAIVTDGITSLGQMTFAYCYKLTSISLPESMENIGVSAFNGCSSLLEIAIPASVNSIGLAAFSGCIKLKEITLPAGIGKIEEQCFYECTSLERIQIPESVTAIGASAFWKCEALKSIDFPASLKTIGSSAFYGCLLLKEMIIPDTVSEIGSGTFAYCNNLERIKLPNLFTSIADQLFYHCSVLETVVLPETVTYVGSKAFSECPELLSVVCGEDLKFIASESFKNSPYVVLSLYQGSIAELYAQINGMTYSYIGTCSVSQVEMAELEYALKSDGTYCVSRVKNSSSAKKAVVPSTYQGRTVTEIGTEAFYQCKKLVYVELAEGLTTIGVQSFAECDSLSSIIIPSTVTTIGVQAFYRDYELVSVHFQKEEYNDILNYISSFPVSSLINTQYLEKQFQTPYYNIHYRHIMGSRSEIDEAILNHYIDEIIQKNGWQEKSNYEKIKGVYDWICKNVTYRYTAASPYSTAVGALIKEDAGCAGYAEAYKLFMDRLGIECQTIVGECVGSYGVVSHMWNIVESMGQWYHVDAADTLYGDYSTFYKSSYYFQIIGHTWDEQKYPHEYTATIIPSTCMSRGYTRHQCNTCEDYFDTDITELTEHTPVILHSVAPTTTATGLTEGEKCGVCGKILKEQQVIPAIPEEKVKLAILSQPQNVSGVIGTNAVLQVEAQGEGLQYHWRYNYTGETKEPPYFLVDGAATHTTMITKQAAERYYWCHITDKEGNAVDTSICRISCVMDPQYTANGVCGDKVSWHLSQDGLLTIEGTGDILANQVSWGDYIDTIRSLVIKEGITTIGAAAFYQASCLRSIQLPETLEKIGDGAFYETMLSSLTLPSHLKEIGDVAFTYGIFNQNTDIVLPSTLEKIGEDAFYRCNINSIFVPPSVTEIGDGALEWTGTVKCLEGSYAHSYCIQNKVAFQLVSAGEVHRPGDTEETENSGEIQPPGNTEESGSSGETQAPDNTEEPGNSGETQAPANTEEPGNSGETQAPTNTEESENPGETQLSNETNSPNETEQPANHTNHTFGAYVIEKKATALQEGRKTRSCLVCGIKESIMIKKIPATIKLTTKKLQLQINKSVNLKKIVTNLADGDKIVSWSSSNKKKVTVDKNGTVYGKKIGTATITVTLASGKKAKLNIVVQKGIVKTIKISGVSSNIEIKKGKKYTLKPVLTPVSSLQKITFTSSNKKIAAVSAKGVITAKKTGKIKIYVKSGKITAICNVTVKK